MVMGPARYGHMPGVFLKGDEAGLGGLGVGPPSSRALSWLTPDDRVRVVCSLSPSLSLVPLTG